MLLIKHIHKCFPDQRSSSLRKHRNWSILFWLLWVLLSVHTFESNHHISSLLSAVPSLSWELQSYLQGPSLKATGYLKQCWKAWCLCLYVAQKTFKHTHMTNLKKHWRWRWPTAPVTQINLIFLAGWFGRIYQAQNEDREPDLSHY